MVAGLVSLSTGLPVMIVGGKKKKQTFQDYKYQYYSQYPSSYFQMSFYSNKIGIAYVF
jgi:adenine/guanine phosphoribosyltransferase-like PRPP-binding protein